MPFSRKRIYHGRMSGTWMKRGFRSEVDVDQIDGNTSSLVGTDNVARSAAQISS
jgi:hypothetical protein